jgi:hypothetical protein
MPNARPKWVAWVFFLTACGAVILETGCFTQLRVERSAPPLVDLESYQPMAVLPSADAPGFPGSGSLVVTASREVLMAKNFVLTAPERGIQAIQEMGQTPEAVSRNAALLRRFAESLGSRIVLVASFLEFRSQKSYISSGTTQVWQGGSYEYQTLPTYHQGTCEMKVSLKLLEVEKAAVVWSAQGSGRGPSGSEEAILRQLVADLLKELPILPEKRG